jgi:hypothetical protein
LSFTAWRVPVIAAAGSGLAGVHLAIGRHEVAGVGLDAHRRELPLGSGALGLELLGDIGGGWPAARSWSAALP